METEDIVRKNFIEKASEIEQKLEELATELEKENDTTAIGVREILSTVHKRFNELLLRK